MEDQLLHYIRAGYSCVQVVTNEEERAVAAIKRMAKVELANTKRPEGYPVWTWSVTNGLRDQDMNMVSYVVKQPAQPGVEPVTRTEVDASQKSKDPVNMLNFLMNSNIKQRSLVVLYDFHMFLKQSNPMLIRLLKEAIAFGRRTNRHLIILGCQVNMQPELEREIVTVDLPLPDRDEIRSVLKSVAKSAASAKVKIDGGNEDSIVEAALGLTTNEAADAFSYSIAKTKTLDPDIVAGIKVDTIRRNGVVDIVDDRVSQDDVGGLEAVKSWLEKRIKSFSKEAKEFGIKAPKGLLAIGISGTGKSLVAKTVASTLRRPMLRLEGGKIFGSWVGESERNMRTALHTADIMAPCVLFIDEIEKALGGSDSSSQCDGGTTTRVVGTFLQWMQDKKSEVFVVATANDVSKLPPEILRRGRFDQIFFVDLPDAEERRHIWNIHIKRVNRNAKDFDLDHLVGLTDGYTGSEIASIVDDGLVNAFFADGKLTTESFAAAVGETIPLSSTMRERIHSMRRWADGRALDASGKKNGARKEVVKA